MGDNEILQDIRERMVRVETKLDNYNGIREKADRAEAKATEVEARSKSNCHRIDRLESNQTWLWRTFVGTLITAIIGGVIALMQGGGK